MRRKELMHFCDVAKEQLLEIPMVRLKNGPSRIISIREHGETKRLVHCDKCGYVFQTTERHEVDCPSCGRMITMDSGNFDPKQNCLIPSELADSKRSMFYALLVTDYDIRQEKVELICYNCQIVQRTSLTPQQAARYAAQQDARLWENAGEKKAYALTNENLTFDSHRIQVAPLNKHTCVVSPEELEDLVSRREWMSTIMGDPKLLDLLRRHHYPLDDGPVALLRFLAAHTDGKKSAMTQTEKKKRRTVLEEKCRMRQMALHFAFSQDELESIGLDERPALWELSDSEGPAAMCLWCPSERKVHEIPFDQHFFQNDSLPVCPVCKGSHSHLMRRDKPTIIYRSWGYVNAQTAEDGTLLIHILVWKGKLDLTRPDLPLSCLPYPIPTPELTDYIICALGKHSFQTFDILAARNNQKADLTASLFRKRLKEFDSFEFPRVEWNIIPGLDQALKESSASWLPLALAGQTVIKQDWRWTLDEGIWCLICRYYKGRDYTNLLENLYKAPILADLAEAGYLETLLHSHKELLSEVNENSTLAEMLEVEDDILPLLPLPECDQSEWIRQRYAELLSVFEGTDRDSLLGLADALLHGREAWMREDFTLLKGFDPKAVAGYLQHNERLLPYGKYLRALNEMELSADTHSQRFPRCLKTTAERADILAQRVKDWQFNWGRPMFPLYPEADSLRDEEFDSIQVQVCWSASDCAWDLFELPYRVAKEDLEYFPCLPLLKAVQNGKTIEMARVVHRVDGLAVCFFSYDESCPQSVVDAFRKYTDTYGMYLEGSEAESNVCL